MVSISVILTRK